MRKSIYWVILVVLICAGNLSADTYYVDDSNGNNDWNGTSPVYVGGDIGPFKTIGQGVQRAENDDTVIVADGLYHGEENLQLYFYHESVTLKSNNGPESCILNFYGDEYHWYFNDSANTLIRGFMIRGIRDENIEIREQSTTVIDNCVFENNVLDNDYSLIKCNEQGNLKLNDCIFRDNILNQGSLVKAYGFASLEIHGCEFTENTSTFDYSMISCGGDCNAIIINTQIDDNWNYRAGEVWGIYCSINANVKIKACYIINNYSNGSFAGVVCKDGANVIISGCNISNNWSMEGTYGVNVEGCGDVDLKTIDCIVSDNFAYSSNNCCGIFCEDCNSSEVINCLITGNNGGVRSYCDEKSTVINCTIVNNKIDYCDGYGIEGNAQVVNCILKDNGNEQLYGRDIVVSYSDICDYTDHIWPGVGNINADPLFADVNNGDYHLLSQAGRWDPAAELWVRDDVSSPCIASGDPADWIGDEPAGSGGRINMGYFGGTSQASKADYCTGVLPGDVNRDCLVNFIDFALMTSDWLGSTIEQP